MKINIFLFTVLALSLTVLAKSTIKNSKSSSRLNSQGPMDRDYQVQPKTYYPLRKVVHPQPHVQRELSKVQEKPVDLRNSHTTTIVPKLTGTIYHGESSEQKSVHGTSPSFLEKTTKKNKKSKKRSHGNDKVFHQARSLRIDGLRAAKEAYTRSGAMLGAIDASPKMVLDVHTTNKREKPDMINQYENNAYLRARVNGMRRSPHGVKAAHTLRRLGR